MLVCLYLSNLCVLYTTYDTEILLTCLPGLLLPGLVSLKDVQPKFKLLNSSIAVWVLSVALDFTLLHY